MTIQERPTPTIEKQADFITYLIHRCTSGMRKGETMVDALLMLKPEDVEDLKHIERRLRMMAPHEREIRNVVAGKVRR